MEGLDRRALLARAGLAGTVLAAAGAGARGAAAASPRPFPPHPDYRFVLVSAATTDPFFVPTQYGAADAAELLSCRYEWRGSANGDVDEIAAAVDAAVAGGADGIAVSVTHPTLLDAPVTRALARGVPVVAFDADRSRRNGRLAFVGIDAAEAGRTLAKRIAAAAGGARAALFAADFRTPRASACLAALRAAGMAVVRVPVAAEDAVARWLETHPRARALHALDRPASRALALAFGRGRVPTEARASGADLLPATLELVRDGRLAFTLDEEPYLQGFLPVVQLFLARVSGGLAAPADVHIPLRFVGRREAERYLRVRTRFEGSSSKHAAVGS